MSSHSNSHFERTELLIGAEGLNRLSRAKVAVFGVGGVGSYTVEALARSGIGSFVLIDRDVVSESNINRQLHALRSTVGQYKTDLMKERIAEINPDARVVCEHLFVLDDLSMFEWDFDYVVDAVDTVTAKLSIISEAKKRNIPIISAMGAGNKLDPTRLKLTDIKKTSVCPLAKVMRRELKKRGIYNLDVVFSDEPPASNTRPPGSIAYVPAISGLLIAHKVVSGILESDKQKGLI